MESLSHNQLIGLVIGLADAVVVLLIVLVSVCVVLFHQRRRLKTVKAGHTDHREGLERFADYLHGQARALAQRYRDRWEGNPTELDRLAHLEQERDPALVMLQLRYDLVRAELLALEASTPAYWETREESLAAHLARWDKAEHALESGLARAPSGDQPGRPAAPAMADESPAPYEAHNRDVEMRRLQDRVAMLEGYRQRFNEMHSATVEERRASANLRTALRKEVADDGTRRQRVDAHLEAYEQARRPLDEYLDRGDIAPFEARPAAQPEGAPRSRNLDRRQRLIDRTGERLDSGYQKLKHSLEEQRQVIATLKTQLEQSELNREELERHYTAKIRQLERQIEETEQSLKLFENESHRNRRQIRKLMMQAEAFDNQRSKITALEDTVDRFSAQAITMQQRIAELEEEREAREVAALTGEDTNGADPNG